jgi:hypothetical protein
VALPYLEGSSRNWSWLHFRTTQRGDAVDSVTRAASADLYSLSRNIGSSVGISVVNSLLTTSTQSNLNPMIVRFWNPMTAVGRAAPDAVVTQQAQVIVCIDDYKLLMIATVAVLPVLIVFKKTSSGAGDRQGAATHCVYPRYHQNYPE